jgi:hypothetical protein
MFHTSAGNASVTGTSWVTNAPAFAGGTRGTVRPAPYWQTSAPRSAPRRLCSHRARRTQRQATKTRSRRAHNSVRSYINICDLANVKWTRSSFALTCFARAFSTRVWRGTLTTGTGTHVTTENTERPTRWRIGVGWQPKNLKKPPTADNWCFLWIQRPVRLVGMTEVGKGGGQKLYGPSWDEPTRDGC